MVGAPTLLILLSIKSVALSLNIIIVPDVLVSYSHVYAWNSVSAGLVAKGHNVTVVIPDFASGSVLENIHTLQYKPSQYNRTHYLAKIYEGGMAAPYAIIDSGALLCQSLMHSKEIMDQLRALKDKFFLLDATFTCGFLLAKSFSCEPKSIGVFLAHPSGVYDRMHLGHVSLLSGYPSVFNEEFTLQPKTIKNRFMNLVSYIIGEYLQTSYAEFLFLDVMAQFNSDLVTTISQNFFLVASHKITDTSRILPPNIQYIGSIEGMRPKEDINNHLKKEVLNWLNSHNHTILVAFGVNDLLSKHMDQRIIEFLEQQDSNFIIKTEMLSISQCTEQRNILFCPWLPQKDVLSHSNVKGFITHGGLNSIHEALNRGVPLALFPQCCDQYFNAFKLSSSNVAFVMKSFCPESLSKALKWMDAASTKLINTKPSIQQLEAYINWIDTHGFNHTIHYQNLQPFYTVHGLDVIFTFLWFLSVLF